ncbi:hypothetical protein MY3296_006603 [Beauveria thailandica]
MSASKRRKLEEGREAPKSALSALSVRRQLAAAAELQDTSSPIEEAPKQRAGNQFSVLQRAAQADHGSPKSPCTAKSAATRQGTTSKRSTEKGEATPESGASTPKVVSYSSFRLNKQNHKKAKDGHCELRLSDSERFVVLGSFGIKVKSGEVAVLGATLTASETIHWVHAPHCHAIPVIRTSEKTHLELHHDKADKPLLRLSSLSPLYQRIWHADEKSSEDTDNSSGDTFRIRAQSSTLVCGPKGAGKSTFSKLLTNRLLTTTNRVSTAQPGPGVAVIDLDPGQPEYAPAGTLSLVHITRPNLGTPFSHPGFHHAGHRVLRSHALASVSPAMSPSLYPSEYTARTGSQLRAMQAMAYFHLANDSAASSLSALSWDPRPISSMPPWEVRYASKRKGIRGILSYDHQSPPELFRAAIDGMVVAVVEIENVEAFRNIIDGYASERRQPDASVEIAGSKAQIEDSTAGKTTTEDELRTVVSPEGLPMISNANDATLDPRYCQAIGLALVRGINTVSKTLQLISPITESQIQSARSQGHDVILVHGKFDAPTWAYAEDFFYQRGTASFGSQTEQRDLDVTYEGTDEDGLDAEPDDTEDVNSVPAVPWLEILQGNQKRPVGSGVWRVRRDLGRNTGD